MTVLDIIQLGPEALAFTVSVSGATAVGVFWGGKLLLKGSISEVRTEIAQLEVRVAEGFIDIDTCKGHRDACKELRDERAKRTPAEATG